MKILFLFLLLPLFCFSDTQTIDTEKFRQYLIREYHKNKDNSLAHEHHNPFYYFYAGKADAYLEISQQLYLFYKDSHD
jgi:hypothetical protein